MMIRFQGRSSFLCVFFCAVSTATEEERNGAH